LDVVVDDVTLSSNGLKLQGSKDKKLFSLSIDFFGDIDPDQSTWTSGSVGRMIFTIKKQGVASKWPKLLSHGANKPSQMHLWWDKQEEFREALEKFDDDEDDDEDDILNKKKEKEKKEKELEKSRLKKQERINKKKVLAEEKRARKKKQLEDEAIRDQNLPQYVIETIEKMNLDLKNEINEMEIELNKTKDEIRFECETKKNKLEEDIKKEINKIEIETENKIKALRYEYDQKSWKDSIDVIMKSVNNHVITLGNAADLLTKAQTHIPKIELIQHDNDNQIQQVGIKVNLSHGISDEHFISSIWVMDNESQEVVGFKSLKDDKDILPPQIEFNIPATVKKVTALAHCNLHGVWSSDVFEIAPLNKKANDEL
jgi:desulfoferrodoxin-like iron-binding protein